MLIARANSCSLTLLADGCSLLADGYWLKAFSALLQCILENLGFHDKESTLVPLLVRMRQIPKFYLGGAVYAVNC
jgi:hypothetical protein